MLRGAGREIPRQRGAEQRPRSARGGLVQQRVELPQLWPGQRASSDQFNSWAEAVVAHRQTTAQSDNIFMTRLDWGFYFASAKRGMADSDDQAGWRIRTKFMNRSLPSFTSGGSRQFCMGQGQ